MGYLIGVIIVIAVIIGLLILVAYIVPFVALALTSWYLGRQLWRQYHRYRLREKFWPILIGIGLLSLLIVTILKVGIILKVLIAASLFTLLSVIAIQIWVFKNKKVPLSRLQLLRDRERSLNRQIGEREEQIADMRDKIARIEEKFSEVIEQKRALEEKISDFCLRDAAVWGIKRKRLEEQYAGLTDHELTQLEANLQSDLSSGRIDYETATLSSYILGLEKLKRKLSSPQRDLNDYQARIQELQSELGPLRREYDRVCREKKLYEDQIAESTRGPIIEIREDIMNDYIRFRQFCSRAYQRWSRWTGP